MKKLFQSRELFRFRIKRVQMFCRAFEGTKLIGLHYMNMKPWSMDEVDFDMPGFHHFEIGFLFISLSINYDYQLQK